MIRELSSSDIGSILEVINDAAQTYRNVAPPDLWKEPYMSIEELKKEINLGVKSYG